MRTAPALWIVMTIGGDGGFFSFTNRKKYPLSVDGLKNLGFFLKGFVILKIIFITLWYRYILVYKIFYLLLL